MNEGLLPWDRNFKCIFFFPWIKFPWHCCSMWDKNWMTQLILAISLKGVTFLDLKRFYYSYAWSCSLCELKEGLPFAWDLSLENSNDSYLCFGLTLLHSVLLLFPLWIFAKILSQKKMENIFQESVNESFWLFSHVFL